MALSLRKSLRHVAPSLTFDPIACNALHGFQPLLYAVPMHGVALLDFGLQHV